MQNNVIKSIFPQTCPHCDKNIMIGVQSVSPIISEIFTEEDVKKSKDEVKKSAKELLTGDELKEALKWIDDENTVFGPQDVPSIISSLKK